MQGKNTPESVVQQQTPGLEHGEFDEQKVKKTTSSKLINLATGVLVGLSVIANPTQASQNNLNSNEKNIPELSIKQVGEKIDTMDHQKIIAMNVDDILKQYPDSGMEIIREHVLIEINNIRQKNSLQPCKQNTKLTKTAQDYSKYMFDNDRFNHKDKSGVGHRERIKNTGYPFENPGEVIETGASTIQEFITLCLYSQEHLNQINGTYFFDAGIGYYNGYRVIDLGGSK